MSNYPNRAPTFNYRWSSDYSPMSPFYNPNRQPVGSGGIQFPPPGAAATGTGTGTNSGTGTTTGGTRPPTPWTYPQLLQTPYPFSLGPDWRSTMMLSGMFPRNQ